MHDPLATHGGRGIPIDRIPGGGFGQMAAIEGVAEPVQHLTQQMLPDADLMHGAGRAHLCVGGDAEHLAKGGEQGLMLGKADHLRQQGEAVVRVAQVAQLADAHPGYHGLEQGACHLGDPATDLDQPAVVDGLTKLAGEVVEGEGHRDRR
ncbi:hypothetical protein D3C80_1159700 [compost metagenome]